MSYSRRPKTEGRRERLTNTSIAQSGAHDKESAEVMSNETDNTALTLEWRGRALRSQDATQATTSSRQLHAAEERKRTLLEIKIQNVRQHYREQEGVLDREIVKLEQRYDREIEQLEQEDKDEDYPIAKSWEVQSDYQPTECGKQ